MEVIDAGRQQRELRAPGRAAAWFGWCFLSGLLIWAALIRSHLPRVPLADPDTWGYLQPALSWLGGHGFSQQDGRAWLYPALIAATLQLGRSFVWIAILQKTLGVASIFLFWCTYRAWARLVLAGKGWRRVVETIVLLAALMMYAASPDEALLEARLRPEGVFAFFAFSYFLCLVLYFESRWIRPRMGSAVWQGASLLALSYVLLLLKPSWGFAIAVPLVLLSFGMISRGPAAMRFLPVVVGLTVTGGLVLFPRLLQFQPDSAAKTFLPITLVCVHADQIVATAPKATSVRPNDPDTWFETVLAATLRRAQKDAGGYHLLRFSPDYIMYETDIFEELRQRQHWEAPQLIAYCYSLYRRAWFQAPLAMLQKICRQFFSFFFPRSGEFYSNRKHFSIAQDFAYSRRYLPPIPNYLHRDTQDLYQRYLDALAAPAKENVPTLHFRPLKWVAILVARLSPFAQLAFLVSLPVVLIKRKQSTAGPLALLAIAASLYGNVLTIAVVHSLDVGRYRQTYAPIYLLLLSGIAVYLGAIAVRPASAYVQRD